MSGPTVARRHKNTYDLTGKRFGRLLVMAYVGSVGKPWRKRVQWLCRCDCGAKKTVYSQSLIRHLTSSCGCLSQENLQKLWQSFLVDLTGQTFSRLTVIERASGRRKRVYWRCSCSCGTETVVSGTSLEAG